MTTESEYILETNLMSQLQGMGYEVAKISDEKQMIANFRVQIEKHNKRVLSDSEFKHILGKINRENIAQCAHILRDRVDYTMDDGTPATVELLNCRSWCKNTFQVANQIKMGDDNEHRYDVTILINGLPLVQIELKKREIRIKDAFDQIKKYHETSYRKGAGLFKYVQLFIISNGVNTKYYSNNKQLDFKQTFCWTDKENNHIRELHEFTDVFLEKCHLAYMITKYMVITKQDVLMVLRPYQFYAAEAIKRTVEYHDGNGYIWHTTGSGKTLTSFKTAQLLSEMDKIDKILFVVDRKDLSKQTREEFERYSEESIANINNTRALVNQFIGGKDKLLVTTLQKLEIAITADRFKPCLEPYQNSRIVIIFDECHRSQFGKTHASIKAFFTKAQMFGFTGTPIFQENKTKVGKIFKTTADIFQKQLHSYKICNAIDDQNVLKFSVVTKITGATTKEHYESDMHREVVVNDILKIHNTKTRNKEFNALFCVDSIPSLLKYLEIFRNKKHKLKIGCIFTYQQANSNENNPMTLAGEKENVGNMKNNEVKEALDLQMQDYNKTFGTNYSTDKSFYEYYEDVQNRIKSNELDICIVVAMLLTGFDAKCINTLYVDKNLEYHGLIQAFSRTNRLNGIKKSHGNIVTYRDLVENRDIALKLFAGENEDVSIVMVGAYEDHVVEFNDAYKRLKDITNKPSEAYDIGDEETIKDFMKQHREMTKVLETIKSFSDFTYDDIICSEQNVADYRSAYLDAKDKLDEFREQAEENGEDTSAYDFDAEIELLQHADINVSYILGLIAELVVSDEDDKEQKKKRIKSIIRQEPTLRSKGSLINNFVDTQIDELEKKEEVIPKFKEYREQQGILNFNDIVASENLNEDKFEKIKTDYIYDRKDPLTRTVAESMNKRPRLKEKIGLVNKIKKKLFKLVDIYFDDDI